MYAFLKAHLPLRLANILIVLWYVGLFCAVMIEAGAPDSGFRYLGL
ncbi:MAG: hypothetical protein HY243_01340 [Proteobacteria bacterium]|nr:hypothetical protein [Pseudomonadota bacterium]